MTLTDHDRVAWEARTARFLPRLVDGLEEAYGARAEEVAARAMEIAAARFAQRPLDLRLHDLGRSVSPDWFQQPSALGYAAYADRFGGDLRGVAQRVDYLAELGVTYLHLLPLLDPRPGENDGGYAVRDYRAVRPDLGTIEDLEHLAGALRRTGIALALDLVVNHVAAEHEWAVRARHGDTRYRDYFHIFPTRTEPDAFERGLPEVFPDWAPGNFTWSAEAGGWVWTTFNAWQWDLNWHNPEVFLEFCDIILDLANRGVECFRLDAIAFLWKRVGTTCQNLPEVHAITQALRAVAAIVAPSVVFKAEAIVAPAELAAYLGSGRRSGQVSDLAYHNSLMVQVWSSLATGDARLATVALRRSEHKPSTTAWATYVRCHDDIGWAIDDRDASAIGWDGPAHRRFLSDFYCGRYADSDARGLVFQANPATDDRRISGTAAALTGIDAARSSGDEMHLDVAVRRFLLAHTIILGFGGLPLIYMGDELALENDLDFGDVGEHAGDNRWAHRPAMDWDLALRRHLPGTVEHRVWHALRHTIAVRASLPAMHASVETVLIDPVNPGVLALLRRHPAQTMLGLYNVSRQEQWWPLAAVPLPTDPVDALTGERPGPGSDVLRLEPYATRWLV